MGVGGLPWGSVVKNPLAYGGGTRDTGSILGFGRPLGEGSGNPLQYFCLGNPMERGAWRATVHGVAKKLSNSTTTVGVRSWAIDWENGYRVTSPYPGRSHCPPGKSSCKETNTADWTHCLYLCFPLKPTKTAVKFVSLNTNTVGCFENVCVYIGLCL